MFHKISQMASWHYFHQLPHVQSLSGPSQRNTVNGESITISNLFLPKLKIIKTVLIQELVVLSCTEHCESLNSNWPAESERIVEFELFLDPDLLGIYGYVWEVLQRKGTLPSLHVNSSQMVKNRIICKKLLHPLVLWRSHCEWSHTFCVADVFYFGCEYDWFWGTQRRIRRNIDRGCCDLSLL